MKHHFLTDHGNKLNSQDKLKLILMFILSFILD